MNYFTALRLAAMAAVKKPDPEYNLRAIHRWYSKTFYTPLHVVADLDPEDVYTAYFETHYEEMDEEAREAEIKELLETPEEAIEADRAWQATEVDSFRYRKMLEAQEAMRKAGEKLGDLKGDAAKKFEGVMRMAPKHKIAETKLPKPKALEQPAPGESITMQFVDEATFEEALNRPSVGPPQKPRPTKQSK